VLAHLQGEVIPFAEAAKGADVMWFVGGYPDPEELNATIPEGWSAPAVLVVQDLFATKLTDAAQIVLPATTAFEKDGTFVNHARLAQQFPRSVRPPHEIRSELQLAFDLLGRRGLVQPRAIRAELAKAIPAFASLAEHDLPATGMRFELALA
jgi:predicted molibdopterin-dependent oxidoreductase YjgC